ncbi:hypothetical protein [Flavobacterium terrae]|uniref:Uncharacterized protein n=1 Tax=Flavobacterium terrae TaxID=415425 RepID=A0A1M6HCC9_9FLAO|nr:hypothetical protein [Flavobacterium terrae]SHJ19759.1 hypothetical protein SAMN05444363_2962 [Flavobacterium terrae]
MFSKGQLIFAVLFFIAFVCVMIFTYRKDLKLHKHYYKGSLWILIAFLLFIGVLFVIKSLLKE